jgi:two-component system, chemotaxis family, chemotaxis protein CheY
LKTCLVVDDSRVIRKVARRILEDLGFQVAEAGDGADALGFCRATMPDAILLDWHMPVMAGPEFLRRLRLEPGGEQPRVIFCSGETRIERIREVLESGADEFMMKPFDAGIMVGKLAAAGIA